MLDEATVACRVTFSGEAIRLLIQIDALQSGSPKNALDLADGDPVDLRNLGRDRSFGLIVTNWRRRRDYSQHARFAH